MHHRVPREGPGSARVRSFRHRPTALALLALIGLVSWSAAGAQTFSITRAEWSSSDGGRLRVEGSGTDGRTVTIRNAGNNAVLGTDTVEDDEWSRRFRGLTQVPCTVSAQQSGSTTVVTRAVSNRPANCGPVAGARPTLSIGNQSANEGNTGTSIMTFTATLSAPAPSGGVSFSFATANGTATAGSDYVATSGTRTIAAGATTATMPVTINGDTTVEPNETFTISITGATSTANATASATGTIVNDDQAQGDAQAPTAPANLTATAAGGSQINLAWSAATDNVGVAAYRVERCTGATCTNFAEIAALGNVTTFANTGLASNTTYRYRVRAGDAAGNLSAYSNVASATTAAGAINRPNQSINSTSQSIAAIPGAKVGEQPAPAPNNSNAPASGSGTTAFQVLAVNDLGMHCGDLDTRISSILPPFNVLHAVALQKGATPVKLSETQVEIRYSAASNATDPILTNPSAVLDPNFRGVYKTNFWDIARQAYDPFYPAGVLAAFYPPAANILDLGLPAPDVERLYLGDRQLAADQQLMPGKAAPYSSSGTTGNAPQPFTQFVGVQPFFTSLPFGYTSTVNWFEAAGIPITTFDDAGRENAYPLMRVQAVARTAIGATPAGTVLASVDTVVPVSGEADCKACHAHTADGGNGTGVQRLGANITVSIEDPRASGNQVPLPVSVEWAADLNILRLHDAKHATSLLAGKTIDPTTGQLSAPVVCQTCHYTPALDLAQLGPDTPAENSHKSMSAVMHKSHGELRNNGFPTLFPDMPGPVGRNAATAQDVLNNTCYMCHPGRRTQCMRGAMGQAGVVCQDCHGNMAQVGADFSQNKPAGAFILGNDFYTNPATPRVPWANEPGCGSCHTGDATSNGRPAPPAGQVYIAAADGIRLLQAYRSGDAKATPIVPTNKRFAENTIVAGATTAPGANPKLYRVSTGHGGLFCEACHGSTHAEWDSTPSATLANANDNKTAQQIQGHSGTIIECRACHGTAYDGAAGVTVGNAGSGPHGMHPVGNDQTVASGATAGPVVSFVDGGHRNGINRALCRTCHGATGQGTVLSETKAPRRLNGVDRPAGFRVTCSLCHGNEL